MFGAFRSTFLCLSGLTKKRRFRLTPSQKYRHRKRLQNVDSLLDVLQESGVKLKALDQARLAPRESELTPFEKYWAPSKRYPDGFKPISWVPKWTRVPHPRAWKPTAIHEPLKK
ncbi:mitochondrial ribosomal protein L31-domain-containing protein [Globomyces pollinis-pini]|nr:mitochondrial ribosomal protein L31-domain-containing protein [Globomyces pollinis-pini]